MKKNIKHALLLSLASELKKLSYASGAVLAANHVFGWFDNTKASFDMAVVWFLAMQIAALYLVYKAAEAADQAKKEAEGPGLDSG